MCSQRKLEQGRRTRSYRTDLQVLIEVPEGTLTVTAIIWLDKGAQSADFEPVGTPQGFRRRALERGTDLRPGLLPIELLPLGEIFISNSSLDQGVRQYAKVTLS